MSAPMHALESEVHGSPPRARRAVHEYSMVRETQMSEVARGVAISRDQATRVPAAQLLERARLLRAAQIRAGERSVEVLAVPAHRGAERRIEPQRRADRRHVEIDARAHEHEEVTARAMAGKAGERVLA